MSPRAGQPAILAVDGGNSKADLAIVAADGSLLAAVRGPTISHQAVGLDRGMANLEQLAAKAVAAAGLADRKGPIAAHAVLALAGADYPEDVRLLRRAIAGLGLATDIEIVNDTFGALRAGTSRPWGIVLVCGQGINAAGVAPDGRTIRFDGVGEHSGDWGGGGGLGQAALAAAVRGRDGRGARTSLEKLVPAHFSVASPAALTKALYFGRIDDHRMWELAPVVFSAAAAGDTVARGILDRLADELVAMAAALVRRLRLGRLDPEIVLAGGVFRADDPVFIARLEAGVRAAAPDARFVRLAAPPVLGAALLALDRLSGTSGTEARTAARLQDALAAWRPA